ncbi:DUF402 domain-containing protein [Halosimplex pelagicum]|uniref:Probable ribonuclease FAU-1 n=1 Tax=Halosimplex pelagicum TaxID=869886 RepID=A0A7D5PEH3_9EURY|nr:DUF402 domain-containing protein [Halosimplex pelagicum]QLH81559.1 DUF402 domain-containing protein [Halosimplex pelagicum]
MSGEDEGPDADGDGDAGTAPTVRVRGIYTTALTRLFEDRGLSVVQASPPIRDRFDDEFAVAPAGAAVSTTDDRQGVGIVGERDAVAAALDAARGVGTDALAWRDPTPRGAVYAGEVTETLGSGAVVKLGDGAAEAPGPGNGEGDDTDETLPPVAGTDPEGFLPYSKTAAHVEEGDRLRVQVKEPAAPWGSGRPVLDATVRVQAGLATLVRGSSPGGNGPELADLLPVDPPEGWGIDWDRAADDADLDALGDALEAVTERAAALDSAFDDAAAPDEAAPGCYWAGEATVWLWFGRESRFGLDDRRRDVTATMPGHHRTKAATNGASAAVDFVEAVCPDAGTGGETDFPFDAVTRQFGPMEGDSVRIDHGKPDGRMFSLGSGEVTRRDADGTVVVEREMSGRGTYDALGVDQQAGDVAVTKLTEGKWWYPTVYRGDDGEKRGTYVNICTPVEVFPSAVRYVDLHVDVVKHADGRVERVDDDELDAAVAAGHVPEALAEKARSVAGAVENAL